MKKVFRHGSGYVNIFTFEEKQFVADEFLPDFESMKQMSRPDIFGGFGIALSACRHRRRYLVLADRLHSAKSVRTNASNLIRA